MRLAAAGGDYLTWDAPRDRRRILANEPFDATGALVLDDLHKHARWRKPGVNRGRAETRIVSADAFLSAIC